MTMPSRPTRAFSLVELLVAATIALGVMAAVATLFGIFGRAASQSQSIVDLSDRMRTAGWRLRQDLAGVTVDLSPWTRPESNSGYFEIIEGTRTDSLAANLTSNIEADTDDVLLFTARSVTGPFVGKYDANTIESPTAEIAWFCKPASSQPVAGLNLYNLCRRQLLVVAYVGAAPFLANNNRIPLPSAIPAITTLADAYTFYDLSLRKDGNFLYPNALSDLTKRENRFLHVPAVSGSGTFPFPFQGVAAASFDGTTREGEDIVLTNVIGFDVRVYDPDAYAWTSGGATLYPGDPGYGGALATVSTAKGAYVDLGWGGGAPTAISGTFPPTGQTAFQSGGLLVSGTTKNLSLSPRVYDTWSLHYESNGVNEDGDSKTDEGSDGIDDDADDLPDDPGEFETSPPYPVSLRGIEVRIRCYEPSSRQVRQVTIRHTFIAR